ncbi:MAG: isocitrate lyase/phosphoenolpyruvate mutase family protein, partial [Acidobacteriota bacterium]
MTRDHASRAAAFRRLHRQDHPLVLVNPWDAGSARWIEHAGAPAIAGTSAGVSWSRGRADGHGLSRAEAMDALRSIIAAVEVPVTGEIEGGYGA